MAIVTNALCHHSKAHLFPPNPVMGLKTLTYILAMSGLLIQRPTACTTLSGMVRSTAGTTWSGIGSSRPSSTYALCMISPSLCSIACPSAVRWVFMPHCCIPYADHCIFQHAQPLRPTCPHHCIRYTRLLHPTCPTVASSHTPDHRVPHAPTIVSDTPNHCVRYTQPLCQIHPTIASSHMPDCC